MRDLPNLIEDSFLHDEGVGKRSKKLKGGIMKKVLILLSLSLCMAAPSFGADVVGHSAKVAGKDTYKVVKVSAKETGKAGKAIVKFLF